MLNRNINILIVITVFTLCACRTHKEVSSTQPVVTDTIIHSYIAIPAPTVAATPPHIMTTLDYYRDAYNELEDMLNGNQPLNFKRAVFLVENTYFKDSLNYETFCKIISTDTAICKKWIANNRLTNYPYADSDKLIKNCAIYTFIRDTVKFSNGGAVLPYQYDFDDFFGEQDWTKMFVTKLFVTHTGNCHSLPYLYKILANELQTDAWLSLAPNHIYIKNRCKQTGWYNTELTSNEFPTDAWIKASGYVTINAIRNGIYMDTLSRQQSIGLCMFDLAKGYLAQTHNYMDGFVLKCCDRVLRYQPNNINAILLKAGTLEKQYTIFSKNCADDKANHAYTDMQALYMLALNLGYRDMPKQMYVAWLKSVQAQKDKFANSEIIYNFNTSKK